MSAHLTLDDAAQQLRPVDVAHGEYRAYRVDGEVVAARVPLPKEHDLRRFVPPGVVTLHDTGVPDLQRLERELRAALVATGRTDLTGLSPADIARHLLR